MTTQLVSQVETAVVYVLVLGALFLVKVAVVELKQLSSYVKTFVVGHTTPKERALLDVLVKATDHVTALALQKGLNFNAQEASAAVGAVL